MVIVPIRELQLVEVAARATSAIESVRFPTGDTSSAPGVAPSAGEIARQSRHARARCRSITRSSMSADQLGALPRPRDAGRADRERVPRHPGAPWLFDRARTLRLPLPPGRAARLRGRSHGAVSGPTSSSDARRRKLVPRRGPQLSPLLAIERERRPDVPLDVEPRTGW
jgi:hypothetical protein